jgi:2-haloacid dehalogenase
MLDDALRASGIADLLDHCFSVDGQRVYKPDPRVYRLVCERLGLEAREISFQSSNAWDVAGAAAFGFQTVWLNRGRQPREYRFAPATFEQPDLSTLPDLLAGHHGAHDQADGLQAKHGTAGST